MPHTGASGTPVCITGPVDLNFWIGDLRESVAFTIVDDLAFLLIVGTVYQEKYFESIQCKTRRLKPSNSLNVAILDALDFQYAP